VRHAALESARWSEPPTIRGSANLTVGSDCRNLLPADPLTHERHSGAALAIRQGYHLSTTVECDDSIRRRQINAVGKDAVKWWGRKELGMWYVEMCRVCSVVHETLELLKVYIHMEGEGECQLVN
jgi:hypothetical protein